MRKDTPFIAIAQLQLGLSHTLNTSTATGEPFFIERRKEVTHLVIPIAQVSENLLDSLGLDRAALHTRQMISGCSYCRTQRHEGGSDDQD